MSVILCTAGYDHTIRFWEALSGICSRTIQHPESQVNRLCITPDKKYLAAAGRHNVKLYDIKSTNPNPVVTFEGHTNNITGVAFHCEGKWMVTSSEDMTVKVWDTRSGIVQRNYPHTHPVNDVVIHPNQGELVSADRGGNIRVWDLGESKCTHQLIPAADVSVSSVSVASDGSLLAAGNNKGDVYIWRMFQDKDSTTLLPCRVFKAHNDYLTRILLSPDSKKLATCSADHTVKIWECAPDEEYLEELPTPENSSHLTHLEVVVIPPRSHHQTPSPPGNPSHYPPRSKTTNAGSGTARSAPTLPTSSPCAATTTRASGKSRPRPSSANTTGTIGERCVSP